MYFLLLTTRAPHHKTTVPHIAPNICVEFFQKTVHTTSRTLKQFLSLREDHMITFFITISIMVYTSASMCSEKNIPEVEPKCLKNNCPKVGTYLYVLGCANFTNHPNNPVQEFSTCFRKKIDRDSHFEDLSPEEKDHLVSFVVSAAFNEQPQSKQTKTIRDLVLSMKSSGDRF